MRHRLNYLVLSIVMILGSRGFYQAKQKERPFNWDALKATYDAYINCPSHENAMVLLDCLPIEEPESTIGDAERIQLHIFGGANFPVVSSEVLAGDRSAVEIMFRFLNIADGAYSETVQTLLAGLVRSKPYLFIEILSTYEDLEHIKRFGPPVEFVEEGYESHLCALKHEYEKRIEALESVKNPKYSAIIEGCIKKLRESIKKYSEKVP